MIVKLKMRPIYKSLLTLIALIIIFLSIIGIMYIVYDDIKNRSYDVEVDGNLSINYKDGKSFEVAKSDEFIFSIVNNSDDVKYYDISLKNVTDKIDYILYDNDNKEIKKGTIKYGNELIISNKLIESQNSVEYKIKITNKSKNDKVNGKIEVKVNEKVVVNFANTILQNNKINDVSLTKVGEEISTSNEGLIKDQDDLGTTYYFRGNVGNNYVRFANLLWRIVRINGDDTVRLILNNLTDNVSNIYIEESTDFEYKNSKLKEYLDIWFQDNIQEYESYISNNKYCSDVNHNDAYIYQANTRLKVNNIPTFTCLGISYNSNIGLISADEVILAGGKIGVSNTNYYLYNSVIESEYFTMTASSGTEKSVKMFAVNSSGAVIEDIDASLFRGVRPVITLIKNVEVKGEGTIENPYEIITNE